MAIGDQLLQPDQGWKRIKHNFYTLKYKGNWYISEENFHYTKTDRSYIEFYVYTSKIRFINFLQNDGAQNSIVYIDGRSVSGYSSYTEENTQNKIVVFEKINMRKSIHKIKIMNVENLQMNIDSIDIDEDGYMVYYNGSKKYYDITPTMSSNNSPEDYEVTTVKQIFAEQYQPWKAFDNDNASCWVSEYTSDSLTIKMKNGLLIDNIIICSSSIDGEEPECMPKDFEFLGSNDNTKYTSLLTIKNSSDWNLNEARFFSLDKKSRYKYYKLKVNKVNGGTHVNIPELRFLLSEDIPFYLIKDNEGYKNYDEESNSLVEVSDISILSDIAINNNCIYDLNKILPLLDLSNTIHVLCNQNIKLKVCGIRTDKEMFISKKNLTLPIADKINHFDPIVSKKANGDCKSVFSLDDGVTWKTYDENTSSFINLSNTFPLELVTNTIPDDLSAEDKTKWYSLQDEIAEKGMSINTMKNRDIASLFNNESNRIRFAHVIIRPTYADQAIVQNLSCNIDEEANYVQSNDVQIAVNSKRLTVTATKEDMKKVKVNLLK